ncbi:MAG: hypothetical protein IE885_02790 [Campylobacterales bacterium]|nr:hypothetical protein [Campylobacterales bacterium]
MDIKTTDRLIVWLKRGLGIAAFTVWIYVIASLSSSNVPFMEQAPYCMVSTMLIFGLLTAAYKSLDHWQKNRK